MNRKRLIFLVKVAISGGIIAFIYGKFVGREGSADLLARLGDLSWGWILAAAAMQLSAIGASLLRWDRLLRGQGIRAPYRHLLGSFMIGRFFGAFTPGGWTGLNGYRLYDIAVQTGKTARSTATIGIEMVLGQLAFGAVVIAGSIFGLEVIGLSGVLMVDGFFVVLIVAAIALISRPALFRALARLLPAFARARLQTTIDAVCAYQGKGGLVTQAAVLGMATHAFNNLIYVCTARALGVELGIGEVFFVSAMQIFSTLVPASVNGIGLREATAVALYTSLGVPGDVAFLVPTVGFAVEMCISAFGGPVFLARRVGYRVEIEVDDPEREQLTHAAIEEAPREAWPRPLRGLSLGLGAGLLGGVLVGLAEGGVILASGSGAPDYGVLAYGAAAYGLACCLGGAGLGLGLSLSGRLLRRAAVAEPLAFARTAALIASFGVFAIGAFRIRRDVYHEMLKWKSGDGLLVLLGCALSAAVLYVMLATLIRMVVARRPGRLALHGASAPLSLIALLALAFATAGRPASPLHEGPLSAATTKPAPAQARDVLFIVVDTLRADHLPLYGYAGGSTPELDAFAKDAVVFDHAFANASWTRPSFASLMTGRYPSSHQTTRKSDSLPDEIETLAEAMQAAGYATRGVVTNYNVAPFFNFQQGFDHYSYLEPDFVLGANDTAAKLLMMQFVRQRIEAMRARNGQVDPGSAYQDAEAVNAAILRFFEGESAAPRYVFAGYMDPHDPYYPHPYDGTGYSRAANQHPDPDEAPALRALYDGEITFWDHHFGKLIAELRQRGLYDDMTIVITSDHGEEFMDHGGYWHGTTLYDEQVHVPLLVKFPAGQRAGQRISHWVESVDIMPTLLRQNGLPVPEGVQGKGLMAASEAVFAEEDHEGNVLRALRLKRGGTELKVIEANPGNPRGLEPFELYRLDQDRGELVNLAEDQAEVLRVAATRLEQQGNVAQVGRAEKRRVDVGADQAAMQKLRALGYAGGEDTPN